MECGIGLYIIYHYFRCKCVVRPPDQWVQIREHVNDYKQAVSIVDVIYNGKKNIKLIKFS
jgi:hypothetical protein